MPLNGNTDNFPLDELFQTFRSNGYSGTFKISRQKETKEILFFDGEINMIPHLKQGHRNLLSLLEKQKKITEEQKKNLDNHTTSTFKLKDLLACAGDLNEEDLSKKLEENLCEELYQLFLWEKASFEFQPNRFPSGYEKGQKENLIFQFSTNNILMEGMRRIDEWQILRKNLFSPKIILVHKPPFSEKSKKSESKVDVYTLVDGNRQIQDMVPLTSLTEFNLYFVLNELIEAEELEVYPFEKSALAFGEALEKKNFSQAIRHLEYTATSPRRESFEIDKKLESLFSHRDFIQSSEAHSISMAVSNLELIDGISKIFKEKHLGTLILSGENRKKYLEITDDQIRVMDTNPRENLKLGEILYRQGTLTQSQIDYCYSFQELMGGLQPIETILLQKKMLTLAELQKALEEKLVEDIGEMFFWDHLEFSFQKNQFDLLSSEEIDHYSCKNTQDLFLKIIFELHVWKDMIQKLPSPNIILKKAENIDPTALNQIEREILAALDGRRNLWNLTEKISIPQLDLCNYIQSFAERGTFGFFAPEELDQKIDEAAQKEKFQQALNFCRSAYQQTRDEKYLDRERELRQLNTSTEAGGKKQMLEGDFDSFPIMDLYQSLNLHRHTGTLTIWGTDQIYTIFFHQGNPALLYPQALDFFSADLKEGFEAVEEHQVWQDLMKIFYLKRCRFQFRINYFPKYYYFADTDKYLKECNCQSLFMQYFSQNEAFKSHFDPLSKMDLILYRTTAPLAEDLQQEPWIQKLEGEKTLRDMYLRDCHYSFSDFIQDVALLMEDGCLAVLEPQKARERLDNQRDLPLEEALVLYEHLSNLEPGPEIQKALQKITPTFYYNLRETEVRFDELLSRREVPPILKNILRRSTFGSFMLNSGGKQMPTYISKREIWIFVFYTEPDLKEATYQVLGRRDVDYKEVFALSESSQIHLSKAMVENQLFGEEEAHQIIENKIVTDLLSHFTLPNKEMSFQPELFPLRAMDSVHRCLQMNIDGEKFIPQIISIVSHPHLPDRSLQDSLVPQRTSGGQANSTLSQEDRFFFSMVDGSRNVGELTGLMGMDKLTLWQLILNLVGEGEVTLVSGQD